VVAAFEAELDEVADGLRGLFGPQLDVQRPVRRIQHHLAFRRWLQHVYRRHLFPYKASPRSSLFFSRSPLSTNASARPDRCLFPTKLGHVWQGGIGKLIRFTYIFFSYYIFIPIYSFFFFYMYSYLFLNNSYFFIMMNNYPYCECLHGEEQEWLGL
jgi:hypothetical protein